MVQSELSLTGKGDLSTVPVDPRTPLQRSWSKARRRLAEALEGVDHASSPPSTRARITRGPRTDSRGKRSFALRLSVDGLPERGGDLFGYGIEAHRSCSKVRKREARLAVRAPEFVALAVVTAHDLDGFADLVTR